MRILVPLEGQRCQVQTSNPPFSVPLKQSDVAHWKRERHHMGQEGGRFLQAKMEVNGT